MTHPEPIPCPFCGSQDVTVEDGSTFRWRHAVCGNCGAQAGEVRAQTLGAGTPEQWEAQAQADAIAEWNTRYVNVAPNRTDDISASLLRIITKDAGG